MQLPQQTVLQEECLLEGRKKGKRDRIGRGRTAPEANPARLPAFFYRTAHYSLADGISRSGHKGKLHHSYIMETNVLPLPVEI